MDLSSNNLFEILPWDHLTSVWKSKVLICPHISSHIILNSWELRGLSLIKFMTFTAHLKTGDSWSSLFLEAKASLCIAQYVVFNFFFQFICNDIYNDYLHILKSFHKLGQLSYLVVLWNLYLSLKTSFSTIPIELCNSVVVMLFHMIIYCHWF